MKKNFVLVALAFSIGSSLFADTIPLDQWMKQHMVYVEGGSFYMGDNADSTRDKHPVTVSSFYMGATEIPQHLYELVMRENPSWIGQNDFYPVENVSWYDAVEFCNRLSIKCGLNPCYTLYSSTNPDNWGVKGENWNAVKCDFTKNGYRLPTEAEWEYAARGGKNNSSYKYSGSNNYSDVAWFSENTGIAVSKVEWVTKDGELHSLKKVANLRPNMLGLYDMSGNVNEWCWDWYDENYYLNCLKDSNNGKKIINPRGPSSGKQRIKRGGDSNSGSEWRTVCRRLSGSPGYRYYFDGFYGYMVTFTNYNGFRLVQSSVRSSGSSGKSSGQTSGDSMFEICRSFLDSLF